MTRILVADDDAAIRSVLSTFLEGEGFDVDAARTGAEVLSRLDDPVPPDLVLVDLSMPEVGGMETLQRMNERGITVPVIVITALGSSVHAIRAIQLGAYDYVTKPFELDDVLLTIRRALRYQQLNAEAKALRDQAEPVDPAARMVGQSAKMLDVYKTIGRVARTDASILIMGETGTGKELVAETIHRNSLRRNGPLVKVACASLPETLLESELFGHEKGSFTSAIEQRKGRFELANKGTIFLDEIGEMTLNTQKKLLRVLQEREIERVGSSTPLKVDVRVVAATNRDLQEEVEAGNFRSDLFYRLNVIAIRTPALREHKEDIPVLVEHFLDKHRIGPTAPPARMSEAALNRLMRHDWPGNVRELENTIERAAVLARGGLITPDHLLMDGSGQGHLLDVEDLVKRQVPLAQVLRDAERDLIVEALRQSDGDAELAAHRLGIERKALDEKMRELDVAEPVLSGT